MTEVMAETTPKLELAGSDGDLNELEVSYENERMENIKCDNPASMSACRLSLMSKTCRNNAALLASLGLHAASSIRPHKVSLPNGGGTSRKPNVSSEEERTRKRMRAKEAAARRVIVEPTRRSGRVAGRSAPDYTG